MLDEKSAQVASELILLLGFLIKENINMSIIVIETHNHDSVDWGVSFNGHNPEPKDYFLAKNKDDAFGLRDIILTKFVPVSVDALF